jgi:hypothetical protein
VGSLDLGNPTDRFPVFVVDRETIRHHIHRPGSFTAAHGGTAPEARRSSRTDPLGSRSELIDIPLQEPTIRRAQLK